MLQQNSSSSMPSSLDPAGIKGSPLITKGPRKVGELPLPRRVPGAPWSLSQAVRNDAKVFTTCSCKTLNLYVRVNINCARW